MLVARAARASSAVESHLELEFEKCYRRFFMPEVRQGTGGSKKRYAGLVGDGDAARLEFVGLEAVRRDWTPLTKRFQRELLDRVFHDRPVDDFVRDFVADLRAGALDDLLAYKKAVRKDLDAYTKTTPPHVKAARKQTGPPARIVEYVMTDAGPEPVDDAPGRARLRALRREAARADRRRRPALRRAALRRSRRPPAPARALV